VRPTTTLCERLPPPTAAAAALKLRCATTPNSCCRCRRDEALRWRALAAAADAPPLPRAALNAADTLAPAPGTSSLRAATAAVTCRILLDGRCARKDETTKQI
jgi:hypothetical protein